MSKLGKSGRPFPRQVRDVHELVNMARLQQGREPLEFPTDKPRRIEETPQAKRFRIRLAELAPESLPAQVLVERRRRGLKQHVAAREIGIGADALSYIESVAVASQYTSQTIVANTEKITAWLAISRTK